MNHSTSLPGISIVVPSSNQAPFIGATLDSLLAQRDPNLEIIVADGGSTDGSVDVPRSYADRITSWVSKRDRGQSEALNKGFLQAVVLLAKLKHLRKWNSARVEAAALYDEMLRELEGKVERPQTLLGNEHVWHLYVVRVKDRDRVVERMHARGIGAGVHYPTPLHMQGAFAQLRYSVGAFPVAESAAREILSLPIFPGITSTQQERVVDELKLAIG